LFASSLSDCCRLLGEITSEATNRDQQTAFKGSCHAHLQLSGPARPCRSIPRSALYALQDDMVRSIATTANPIYRKQHHPSLPLAERTTVIHRQPCLDFRYSTAQHVGQDSTISATQNANSQIFGAAACGSSGLLRVKLLKRAAHPIPSGASTCFPHVFISAGNMHPRSREHSLITRTMHFSCHVLFARMLHAVLREADRIYSDRK
jgi:hypothetical protein